MKWVFLLVFSHILVFAGTDFSDFDSFQEKLTRNEVEERLSSFLQKDASVGGYFSLTEDAFILYDAPESQKDRRVNYELRLACSKKIFSPKIKEKNLVGVKIAIDPGHLGGPYARLEERFIDIPPSIECLEPIRFDEGTLTFLTARYLKVLLEKEGAIVMLTRDGVGKSVYQEDFFDWLKKKPSLWTGEIALNKLFVKHYNPLDLRARAEKINAFSPDLTVVIHYNSHHVAEEANSNASVAAKNYNFVHIPGAFCKWELVLEENRYEFLRLLVTDHVAKSLDLSRRVLKNFEQKLQIPAVCKADGVRYLDKISIEVEKGVFARNLALTRLIRSPLCYGESLIQNNIDECQNLNRKDFVIDGIKCSSRIKQVAESYFEGIREYVLN